MKPAIQVTSESLLHLQIALESLNGWCSMREIVWSYLVTFEEQASLFQIFEITISLERIRAAIPIWFGGLMMRCFLPCTLSCWKRWNYLATCRGLSSSSRWRKYHWKRRNRWIAARFEHAPISLSFRTNFWTRGRRRLFWAGERGCRNNIARWALDKNFVFQGILRSSSTKDSLVAWRSSHHLLNSWQVSISLKIVGTGSYRLFNDGDFPFTAWWLSHPPRIVNGEILTSNYSASRRGKTFHTTGKGLKVKQRTRKLDFSNTQYRRALVHRAVITDCQVRGSRNYVVKVFLLSVHSRCEINWSEWQRSPSTGFATHICLWCHDPRTLLKVHAWSFLYSFCRR